LVLVLKSWAERAAHQEELAEIVPLGRLPHDVVEICVAVAREQHIRLTGSELGQHRAEILGAGLEQLELAFDALLLEQRGVDIDEHLAALVVLEQHSDLLGTSFLTSLSTIKLPNPFGPASQFQVRRRKSCSGVPRKSWMRVAPPISRNLPLNCLA